MKALLYHDLTTGALTDGSSTWTPPTQTFGGSLEISLRFQETTDGTQSQVYPTVSYIKAAIGNVDARPTDGKWRLKIGDDAQSPTNTTAALDYNAGAATVQNAINALADSGTRFGVATVKTLADSYLISFSDGSSNISLALVESQLHPPCFGQVYSWQVAGAWVSELRLIQAPVAFCDSSERVLPDAPSIALIQDGGENAGFTWNEIQQLTMPPAFLGSYQFKFKGTRSALLSKQAKISEIATALAVFGNTITVTWPRDDIARIEFGGTDFKGVDVPLLEVVVVDAPEGDLTFNLELNKAPLAAILRTEEEVTLPLEMEIGIEDSKVDGGIRVEKVRSEVTIRRGVIYDLLAAAAGVNWLRPVAKNYVPFTQDQIIVGQQFYACALGDGEALAFVVDHGLNTETIACVLLRENAADGKVLTQGVDYSIVYGGANSLTVNWLGVDAPASASLALVVTAAGPIAAFQAHTHTIAQVLNLEAALEDIISRVATLETYLPSTSPGVTDSTASSLTITIPAAESVLFYSLASTVKTLDLSALGVRGPYLLPAVHQAAEATELPDPLPAPTANALWTAPSRVLVPGTGRISASYAAAGDYVASDGRILYPARRQGATASYYPAPFEQPLFEFGINEDMLSLNRTLEVKFGVTVQLINATSEAQWVLVIEQGVPTDQSVPANTDLDLEDVTWSPTPILKKRLIVTGLAALHTFGCRIKRTGDTTLTADKMLYGTWSVATGTAPASANFVIRARLIEFDTKNNVPDATGWLYHNLSSVDGGKTDTKATIS